ncbi:hypothetical protein LIA77_09477 [Sarocladium implicatum]|nr:hypothetical protein LIA77_09477 [Sarocladium implicatum]
MYCRQVASRVLPNCKLCSHAEASYLTWRISQRKDSFKGWAPSSSSCYASFKTPNGWSRKGYSARRVSLAGTPTCRLSSSLSCLMEYPKRQSKHGPLQSGAYSPSCACMRYLAKPGEEGADPCPSA